MITNVSTLPVPSAPLAPRPETRTDAESLVRAFAAGAAAYADDDDSVRQCARMLAVILWRDIDQTEFSLLVDDVIKAGQLRSGVSLQDLFGDDEDSESTRGDWLFYYETQISWHVDCILSAAGYRR